MGKDLGGRDVCNSSLSHKSSFCFCCYGEGALITSFAGRFAFLRGHSVISCLIEPQVVQPSTIGLSSFSCKAFAEVSGINSRPIFDVGGFCSLAHLSQYELLHIALLNHGVYNTYPMIQQYVL